METYQRDEDMHEKASELIIRPPPKRDIVPLQHDLELVPIRRRVSRRYITLRHRLRESSGLRRIDLLPHALVLWGVEPDVVPVAVTDPRSETSTDGVEHVFSGVNVGRAYGAMTSEVITEDT